MNKEKIVSICDDIHLLNDDLNYHTKKLFKLNYSLHELFQIIIVTNFVLMSLMVAFHQVGIIFIFFLIMTIMFDIKFYCDTRNMFAAIKRVRNNIESITDNIKLDYTYIRAEVRKD